MAVPIITDRPALRRRLARAAGRHGRDARFLLDRAIDDLMARLGVVERRFDRAIAMSGFGRSLADRMVESSRTGTVYQMEISSALAVGANVPAFVGDEESLPLAPASVDLIASTLALQYVNDLPGALFQVRRALRPDGLLLASMFGGQTLQELRQAFVAAELELRGGAGPRFLPMADVRDLGGLLQRAGFALPVADRDVFTVRYANAFDLMQDLKAMGASNMLAERERTPMRRDVLLAAAEIYQRRFSDPDGRIRATFEMISLSGWAPHDSQQKPAERGSASVSLADYLKQE